MPNTIGMDISLIPDRYVVEYDDILKVWRIIDNKHPKMLEFRDLDEDVPDDHPAVTLIPELMFSRLMAEAINVGILSPAAVGLPANAVGPAAQEEALATTKEEETDKLKLQLEKARNELADKNVVIAKLESKIEALQEQPKGSEGYMLKNKALDILKQITVAGDINEITRLL